MKSSLEICEISNACNWNQVLGMPRLSVDVDWWGRSLLRPFRYALGCDAQHLVYVCEVPEKAPPPADHLRGAFMVDLAEPDTRGQTGELFVLREDGRYFEIHISADGAWWYMNFAKYRTREPGYIPKDVAVTVEYLDQSWVGAIRLPFAALPISRGDAVRYQASAAICSGESPVYITSAGVPDFEPDLHDARVFRQLKI
jgi:hypothetical protein